MSEFFTPQGKHLRVLEGGTLSVRRFLRPLGYQNMPESILPEDIR